MKKILLFAIFCTLFSFANGQTSHRDYIKSKLIVYYVHDPTAAMPASGTPAFNNMRVNLNDIASNGSTSGNFESTSTNRGLKTLLKKLLRPYNQGGDRKLQREVRGVLSLTNKPVVVFMYNDFTAPSSLHNDWDSKAIHCSITGDPTRSWPCANTLPSKPALAGHIGIGAYFFGASTAVGGYSTDAERAHVFVHELVHTQLDAPLESTLSGVRPYGEGGHYWDELIPSQNWSFNEGIATAFALRYHFISGMSVTSWLNNNSSVFVDSPTTGCSSSSASNHCLEARLTAAGVTGTAGTVGTSPNTIPVKLYNIRDIPIKQMCNNETMFANVFYQYMQQFRSTALMTRSLRNSVSSFSASNNSFNKVFREMVKAGNNFSNRNNPEGTRTHGQHVPLAILDYYTGYKLTDKAALGTALGSSWSSSDTNIDDYFSSKRSVLLGFRSSATNWNVSQLSRFSEHVHVRTPRRATAASRGGN